MSRYWSLEALRPTNNGLWAGQFVSGCTIDNQQREPNNGTIVLKKKLHMPHDLRAYTYTPWQSLCLQNAGIVCNTAIRCGHGRNRSRTSCAWLVRLTTVKYMAIPVCGAVDSPIRGDTGMVRIRIATHDRARRRPPWLIWHRMTDGVKEAYCHTVDRSAASYRDPWSYNLSSPQVNPSHPQVLCTWQSIRITLCRKFCTAIIMEQPYYEIMVRIIIVLY